MDNAGDWVYILLVAVGIIASLWPKKRKIEVVESPIELPEADIEEDSFWLEGGNSGRPMESRVADIPATFGNYKSHVAIVMTDPDPIEDPEIERTDLSNQRWRQSIVDAEILKPKYQSY